MTNLPDPAKFLVSQKLGIDCKRRGKKYMKGNNLESPTFYLALTIKLYSFCFTHQNQSKHFQMTLSGCLILKGQKKSERSSSERAQQFLRPALTQRTIFLVGCHCCCFLERMKTIDSKGTSMPT